jgi:octaprenyl-diphosphate synthase
MSNTLSEIKIPVKEELIKFEAHFRESMRSHIALLDKIMYYVVKRKGKQIRPLLVFLTAKMCGKISDTTYVAASLVELLHTASLVHDDVVDDAVKRRGFFSINALWKNKIAVLVGDYLLSRGLLVALENNEFRTLQIFTVSVKMMVEGELMQFEKARKLDIKEEVYFDIIKQKTASLIAAACSAGAASAGCDEKTIEKMRLFGEKIGIAFQIKDDLFDYGDQDIGKPLGIDIKEKKMTLPLIYSLQKTDKSTRNKLINGIKNKSENKKFASEVIAFVKQSGGLEYATSKMELFQQEAIEILHSLEESDARNAMEKLVYFITSRNK